jgi:hypothetical protein
VAETPGEDRTSGFVAECFVPGLTRAAVELLDARAREVVARLAADGEVLRYHGCVLFPADETVLFQFEAGSEGVVRRASQRARIPFERIVESVRVSAPAGGGGISVR